MPQIIVKYLLWLRDKASTDKDVFIFQSEVTLKELVDKIIEKRPTLKKFLENVFDKNNNIIILINGKPGKQDKILRNNDIVSIIPPVSGG
ncbi:MAG: MoaD/ThiS family protein [Thermoprotei archaeon]|nr:MAG: MoaD/ThiS family protein [Thermoprotei archaeon]